jgi:microcystin-dependent protein
MSIYSDNLKLELITTGTQAGTWGNTTNTNLGTLVEQAISGVVTQAMADADQTITIPDGATGVARNMFIECTGALTAARSLIVPTNKKLYFISNATTGGFAITVKVSGQTGVSVPMGAKVILVMNSAGTDIVVATNYMSALTLGAALPVTSGGTGVTTSTGSGANVLGTSPTIASPTLTGTPVAPTASAGTNTTQIATTAFVTTGLQAAYPVGSIYVSTVSTNPNTLFGFGTWVAYGQGRMLISQDGTYTAGSTGGAATATLITANLPSHSHSATTTSTDSGHTHGSAIGSGFISNGGPESLAGGPNLPFGRPSATASGNASITSTTTIGNTGSGTAVTTISPYIAVYMWNRTV